MGSWLSNIGLSLVGLVVFALIGALGVYLLVAGLRVAGMACLLGLIAWILWAGFRSRPNGAWR